MAINFVKMQALAKRLIEAHGRSVSIIKLDETPTDSAAPWRGNTAPLNPPTSTVTAIGVFVEPESLKDFGFQASQDTLGNIRFDKIALVAYTSLNVNLETYDQITDADGLTWKIMRVKILQPGTERIIYTMGLRQ